MNASGRWIVVALCSAVALCLVGCGDDEEEAPEAPPPSSATDAAFGRWVLEQADAARQRAIANPDPATSAEVQARQNGDLQGVKVSAGYYGASRSGDSSFTLRLLVLPDGRARYLGFHEGFFDADNAPWPDEVPPAVREWDEYVRATIASGCSFPEATEDEYRRVQGYATDFPIEHTEMAGAACRSRAEQLETGARPANRILLEYSTTEGGVGVGDVRLTESGATLE